MNDFDTILRRAEERKGGRDNLTALLPQPANSDSVISKPDSYYLEEMTRSIFQSGFVWKVINNKWPSIREAFFEFDLNHLMKLSDREWEGYLNDRRIVRHRQKINALRHNVWFVHETAHQYEGFGRFLYAWPKNKLVELFAFLKQKGSRLGGNTGQYYLQHVGIDSFALTRDVVQALQAHGLDIHDNPTSKKDLALIQQTFNDWSAETGFGLMQLSYVLAFSVGENRTQVDTSTF